MVRYNTVYMASGMWYSMIYGFVWYGTRILRPFSPIASQSSPQKEYRGRRCQCTGGQVKVSQVRGNTNNI